MPRPTDGRGRVDSDHLAGDQPVEEVADCGELLLDGGRGNHLPLRLDPGGHVQRLHCGEGRRSGRFAPGEKLACGSHVSPPRVAVPNVGGEELDESNPCSLIRLDDQCRQ